MICQLLLYFLIKLTTQFGDEPEKRRGNCLLSVPRTEAFALSEIVEQTTLEPTPLYLNITYKPHAYIKTNYSLFWRKICSMQAETCSVVNTHLDIYRCNAPDYFLEICEVSVRLGTKRQVNAFSICLNSISHPKPASERMHPITMDSSFGPA